MIILRDSALTVESRTAKRVRQGQEVIGKHLPIRDFVKQQLQYRKEDRTKFAEHESELFKPVTVITKDILVSI
ncbi:hypothetical protein ACJMK2_003756 [Sinanodonta woodiana]|uniref:Uncharacterized protein n=1 Tax=Sinanodonta woodiana TaxID=1069815 RepID=A0ABD3Y136_SINWO